MLELVQMGAEFTRNHDGTLHLTKEGGHSKRRVVHAADMTGREIERALLMTARSHRNIRFFEHHLAVDLVVDQHGGMPHCFGADVLDQRTMTMTRCVVLPGSQCPTPCLSMAVVIKGSRVVLAVASYAALCDTHAHLWLILYAGSLL